MKSSVHSNYHRRQERPYRPPERYDRSYPPRQPYSLLLIRNGVSKSPTTTEIETLIESCTKRPSNMAVHQSGRLAAVLTYITRMEAVAAAAYFWKCRLDGSHVLTMKINPPAVPNSPVFNYEQRHICNEFLNHVSDEIESDQGVRICEERIDQLRTEIQKVSQLLSMRNKFAVFTELQEKKRRIEIDLDRVESRLREFREAMDCILGYLRDGHGVEEEDDRVRVFKLEKKLDFERLHKLIVREFRRLHEGLPVYGYRRKILNHIFSNQVLVLIGETGSGKSTQLVQYLADSGVSKTGSIICTQPRKIAAISLSQRVTEETNGCYNENYILSFPSISNQNNFNSKNIIFTTDHCFLQNCMNGDISENSYILVDEAHERSINTDLLLALIKKLLLKRMDLRLIIMSATADASKLAEYFYGCRVLRVSGRAYPVDVKYVPSGVKEKGFFCNYVSDVIKTVAMVHKSEPEGAILAFLTSQIDVEHACDSFTDPTAVVLPMHGKLSVEEQSLVFKNYVGKRKIIFSTNIAETALTIRGVKYVVDSGVVKECRFEPKNGMNVLKVNWITQSSANQRAGRAGRTCPGKCFRVYSESDFNAMDLHQEPEIKRVHLGMAVLRILSLGVRNVQEFEFVDSPDPQAIETAVKNLIQLGAISKVSDGFVLTDTGRSLVKLGIEPRLGKIILDSFACGLKKEGLVLAAVMANASSIFCRVGSVEEKHKADCLKVPFCHPDGDLFTLLTVYKKWEEERENRNKWCWRNSINAKSLRRCNETVKELENCLKHESNTIIPSYWTWDPENKTAHDKALKRIILSCLVENIAVFSGHERLGYRVALTGQNVQLHPSCSLLMYDKNPNWVAFGELLSSPNQYLVCVTAMDHDDLCTITNPPFDMKMLESSKLHSKSITEVSSIVLRKLCGKSCTNLQRLISQLRKNFNDDRISIEADFEGNEIQVFATEKDIEKAFLALTGALEREKKWLRDECSERVLYPVRLEQYSPQIALLGSGGVIKHLELDKRYLTIEILHPNAQNLFEKDLITLIDRQVNGGIVSVHKFVGPDLDRWGRVTFNTPNKAEYAVGVLNGLDFEGADLKAFPVLCSGNHRSLHFPAVRAKVSWPRRPIKGIALLTCPKGQALQILQDMVITIIGDRYIHCKVSEKYEDCIFATGIPRNVPEHEIYSEFRRMTQNRILEVKLFRAEAAVNSPSESQCKDSLVRAINRYFPEKNFKVGVFAPNAVDYFMKAAITFDGSLHLEAAKALENLEGSVLPGCQPWQTIQCQHVFQSVLTCPMRVCQVVREQVELLLKEFQTQKGISYNLERSENGLFRVKITANATKTIADVRKPLEQLMKGKIVNLPASLFNLILSREGLQTINSIERETKTYILYDRQCVNVKIFGASHRVDVAEKKLLELLNLMNENKLLEIRLKGRGLPSDLMKEVVKRFGSDLGALKEIAPGLEISLNTKKHVLYVRGTKEDKQKVEDAVADVAASIGSDSGITDPSTSDSCPICLCDLEEPYKLESCGHEFCRGCLIDQFETSIRSRDTFPLCCLKQNCKTPILFLDLKTLLPPTKLDELFRASLGYFVATNSSKLRFCPTPDCPSVYKIQPRNSSEEKPFICGACYAETCTRCNLEYHPFVTCEQYKEYKADPDLSLNEWRKGKMDVRNCPTQCGYIIEKVDGCDHVMCKCSKHVCWGCMEFFDTEQECYSHIHSGECRN